MSRRFDASLLALAACSCLALAGPAQAQFPACDPFPIATVTSPVPLTTGLVMATTFVLPRGFVGAGSQLRAYDPLTKSWPWSTAMGGAVIADPVPARLENGSEVVFASLEFGHLACVRASDGFVLWNKDLRTVAPDPGDGLAGSPAVQLRAESDSVFRAAVPNDLVFVATHFVTTYNNRVYALNVADGSARWTFNITGTLNMNAASAAPTMDLARDVIYVGTEQASPTQNSLWAMRSTSGLRAWTGFGVPAGRIRPSPLLVGSRLYTTGPDDQLRATRCDSLGGTSIWTLPLASTPVGDLVRVPTPVGTVISTLCTGDVLRLVSDGGDFASELLPLPGLSIGPVYLWGAGLGYGISPAGEVQAFDPSIGFPLGAPTHLCGDPEMHLSLAHVPALAPAWRLEVTGGGRYGDYLTELCIPWSYGEAPQACLAAASPNGSGIPAAAGLGMPCPNPTGSGTRFALATARSGRATLLLTDVLGRRVRVLDEAVPTTGERSLAWDGRDAAGHPVPPGLYSARLSVDGVPTAGKRKVLVVR